MKTLPLECCSVQDVLVAMRPDFNLMGSARPARAESEELNLPLDGGTRCRMENLGVTEVFVQEMQHWIVFYKHGGKERRVTCVAESASGAVASMLTQVASETPGHLNRLCPEECFA